MRITWPWAVVTFVLATAVTGGAQTTTALPPPTATGTGAGAAGAAADPIANARAARLKGAKEAITARETAEKAAIDEWAAVEKVMIERRAAVENVSIDPRASAEVRLAAEKAIRARADAELATLAAQVSARKRSIGTQVKVEQALIEQQIDLEAALIDDRAARAALGGRGVYAPFVPVSPRGVYAPFGPATRGFGSGGSGLGGFGSGGLGLGGFPGGRTVQFPGLRSGLQPDWERTLVWAAREGTRLFNDRKYDEAYHLFRGTLLGLERDLSSWASPELSGRVSRAIRMAALPKYAGSERALILRTALNDIRNEPWRSAGSDPWESLEFRLGGPEVVKRVIHEVRTASSGTVTDCDPFDSFDGFLVPGPFGTRVGGLGSFQSPGTMYFARPTTRMKTRFESRAALGERLHEALMGYCVPDPEIDEVLTLWYQDGYEP